MAPPRRLSQGLSGKPPEPHGTSQAFIEGPRGSPRGWRGGSPGGGLAGVIAMVGQGWHGTQGGGGWPWRLRRGVGWGVLGNAWLRAPGGCRVGWPPRPPQGGGARWVPGGWVGGVVWGAGGWSYLSGGAGGGFGGDRLHGAGGGVSRAGAGGCSGGLRGAGQVHTKMQHLKVPIPSMSRGAGRCAAHPGWGALLRCWEVHFWFYG